MLLPNRHGSIDSYRYGFQGQEKDDEIKGEGNSINYKYRMHDPRVGRFFAVDPKSRNYPWLSSYQFSGNRVIDMVELEGLEPDVPEYKWSSTPGFQYLFNPYGRGGAIMLVDGWTVYTSIDNEANVKHQYYNYVTEEWKDFDPVAPQSLKSEIDKMMTPEFLWGLAKEVGHESLDAIGTLPVVGEPADGLNAIWYYADGDMVNGSLSLAGMVPFAGWAATGTKYGLKLVGKNIDNIDDFYKAASKLAPGERVAMYKDVGNQIAKENGWVKKADIQKKNKGRTIYTDPKDGKHYSLDTQHGTFKVLNKKGKHQGEVDFGGNKKKDADTTGAHDINI